MPLTYEQFRYSFANAVGEDEARELYDTFAVPAPGEPLFQAAAANLNPWTEVKADTVAAGRGRLLIVSARGTTPSRGPSPTPRTRSRRGNSGL
ncbi:hypothetical protein AB0D54_15615 [Streptomyces xanthophaeus]